MTDKERLLRLIKALPENCTFEEIVEAYIINFSASRLNKLVIKIQNIIDYEIRILESTKSVAMERAIYLKQYLSGDMWPTEEIAKNHVQPQINNAQAIIDACDGKYDFRF